MMFIYIDYNFDFGLWLNFLGLFVGIALVGLGMAFNGFFNNDENKNKRRPPSKKNPVSKNEDKTNCLLLERDWRQKQAELSELSLRFELLKQKKEVLESSGVVVKGSELAEINLRMSNVFLFISNITTEIRSLQNKISAIDSSMTVDILFDRSKNDADSSLLNAEIEASVDIGDDVANIAADAKAAFEGEASLADGDEWSWRRIIILSSGVILVVASVIRKVIEHTTN